MSNIIGGIVLNNNYFITTNIGGTDYFLAYYTDDSDKNNKITKYQFVTKEDKENKFAYFVTTSNPSTSGIIIKDVVNGGGLVQDSDKKYINSNTPTSVKYSQDTYAEWDNTLFLSNVGYKLDGSFRVMGQSEVNKNIIFIPIAQYYSCPSNSNTHQGSTTASQALNNWLLAASSSKAISNSGWTTFNDCRDGVMYDYCPVGKSCGTDNCKGNCSATGNYCDYKDPNFYCGITAEDYLTTQKWWKSKWFIISAVFIVIAAIVVSLIIVFVVYNKKKKKALADGTAKK